MILPPLIWTFFAVIGIVIAYVLVVFVLTHSVVPNYGWKKTPLPHGISDQLLREIESLAKMYRTPDMFLRAAFELISKRYPVKSRIGVIRHPFSVFVKSPEKLWNMHGSYLHCHQMNLLLRIFLVKSNLFKDEHIEPHYSILNLFTHQYLHVKVDDDTLFIDPWAFKFRVPFGKFAQGWM